MPKLNIRAAVNRTVAIDSNVPIADSHNLEDLTFVVSTRQGRAVIQFAQSDFSIGGRQCSVTGYSPTAAYRQPTSIFLDAGLLPFAETNFLSKAAVAITNCYSGMRTLSTVGVQLADINYGSLGVLCSRRADRTTFLTLYGASVSCLQLM